MIQPKVFMVPPVTGNNLGIVLPNRPCSIYQYSNMAPRLSDKLLNLALFSLYPTLFWELRDERNFKSLQFWPESLGAMLEYWYIERGLLYDWCGKHVLTKLSFLFPIKTAFWFSFKGVSNWCVHCLCKGWNDQSQALASFEKICPSVWNGFWETLML